jgi:hypothetical protein
MKPVIRVAKPVSRGRYPFCILSAKRHFIFVGFEELILDFDVEK